MKIGLALPHLGPEATKENILQIAVNAEKEGLDSLWVAERLLWPLNPRTPYPASPDGSLPTFYQNVFNPFKYTDVCSLLIQTKLHWEHQL